MENIIKKFIKKDFHKVILNYLKETIFYKIYIEWVAKLTLIFFLILEFYKPIIDEFITWIIWIIVISISVFDDKKKKIRWKDFLKSASIFIWLVFLLVHYKYTDNLFIFSNNNILLTIIISIFIMPIIIFYYKNIFQIILKTTSKIWLFFKYILNSILNLISLLFWWIIKIFSYIMTNLLLAMAYLIAFLLWIWILWNLWPIIEPNYVYWVVSNLAISYLLKLISIYFLIIIIYTALYFIYFKKIIKKYIFDRKDEYEEKLSILNKKINELSENIEKQKEQLEKEEKDLKHKIFVLNLWVFLKNKNIYYFIWLYLITFIIDRFILLIF